MAILPTTAARRALAGVIARGELGRVASVVSRYGRGPRALKLLRRQFKGLPVQLRRHIMSFAFGGTQAPKLQTRMRLFLKDIPIARGLGQHMAEGSRVRYGIATTWLNTDPGQTGKMFMNQDYDAPQLTDQLEEEAADRAKENINESPGSFGVPGMSNIQILNVEQVYVFRSF